MTATAAKPRARRRKRPIYFQVRRVVDEATGEILGALVPLTKWDRKAMHDRRYSVGTEVRADLKKPRCVKFNNLVHVLGTMLVRDLEAFEGMGAHDAIKRCQREAGLYCEQLDAEVPGVGVLRINQAQSIAFDEMEEGDFQLFWRGLCRHVSAKYWPTMTEDQIADQAELMESTGP